MASPSVNNTCNNTEIDLDLEVPSSEKPTPTMEQSVRIDDRFLPTISMQEHAGNEKSWVWHAADFVNG
nr:ran-binding protein 1 homolog C-like [Ipomoea batatas]